MLIKQRIIENFEQELDKVKEFNVGVLISKIKHAGGITKEQNEILLKRYITKKEAAADVENIIERTILILVNDGLIWYVVGQHFGSDEDLYSVGKLGMIKAIDNFSFDRDCSFASFATKVMINEILMQKRKEKRQMETINAISLDAPVEENKCEGGIRYDTIASNEDFVEEIVEEEYCRYIEKLFVYLTPVEQRVMIHSFGLFGNRPQNQQEVAKLVGVSQSYVSRLLETVPQKLKILLSNKGVNINYEYKRLTQKRYGLVKD